MLRTFGQLGVPVNEIHMVEVSKGMRELQAEKLEVSVTEEDSEGRLKEGTIEGGKMKVFWHDNVSELPKAEPDIVEYTVAQEVSK